MRKQMVIFDLDGTLVDTKKFIIEALNELSIPFNFDDLDDRDVWRLRNTHSIDFLKVLGIPLWKGPFLVRRIQSMLSSRIDDMYFVPDMKEVLMELKDKGYILGVISSNSKKNVKLFFKKYRHKFFDFKIGSVFVFGKHKVLKRLGRKNGVDIKDVYYVGDETRDIEAAKRAGAKVIAVTWGFNTREILASLKPDCIAHTPREILACLLPR